MSLAEACLTGELLQGWVMKLARRKVGVTEWCRVELTLVRAVSTQGCDAMYIESRAVDKQEGSAGITQEMQDCCDLQPLEPKLMVGWKDAAEEAWPGREVPVAPRGQSAYTTFSLEQGRRANFRMKC